MADFILVNGDAVIFDPAFLGATISVAPGEIKGSGASQYQQKEVCVFGDEKSVKVENCRYITAIFTAQGRGTLKILALASNQIARKTISRSKKVLLKGGWFQAVFEVQEPAKSPKGEVDPMPYYIGKGNFKTVNTLYKGS